jgi:F-type H+-transporting ATPase subunit a
MNVSLKAETIFSIGGFGITNAMFSMLLLFIVMVLFILWVNRNLSYDKPKKWQLMLEMVISILYNMVKDVLGKEKTKMLFGFLFTFFFIILLSNWFGLLPFVPAIAINEHEVATKTETTSATANNVIAASQPMLTNEEVVSISEPEKKVEEVNFQTCFASKDCYLTIRGVERFEKSAHVFRAPTSDLSFTIALAIISLVVTNALGFKFLKLGYAKRYFNFSNAMDGIVGIIEFVSEISKILSFSFRLFGNIFAGEMLLVVITSLTIGLATLPFYALEIFVGVIQAFVFLMLTTVFISVATADHH